MKRGKKVCETLKTIRKQIADANDIKYEPKECHHEGDCAGTCPACEAEVRYLESELSMRRKLGKAVAVVGISAGLAGLTSSCHLIGNQPTAGMPMEPPSVVADSASNDSCTSAVNVIGGDTDEEDDLAGMPEMPEDEETE